MPSSASKSVKFCSYQDDYYIKNCFNKIKRYENHIKLFESHLENGSSTPKLFYNKFPVPFLADDEDFVDQYNDLIKEFQVRAMLLSKEFLLKRIEKNENKIRGKKQILKEKNDDNSVDAHIKTLENKVDKDLEKYFELKNEQFNRITIQKYQVKNNKNKSKNQNNNPNDSDESVVSIYETTKSNGAGAKKK